MLDTELSWANKKQVSYQQCPITVTVRWSQHPSLSLSGQNLLQWWHGNVVRKTDGRNVWWWRFFPCPAPQWRVFYTDVLSFPLLRPVNINMTAALAPSTSTITQENSKQLTMLACFNFKVLACRHNTTMITKSHLFSLEKQTS